MGPRQKPVDPCKEQLGDNPASVGRYFGKKQHYVDVIYLNG